MIDEIRSYFTSVIQEVDSDLRQHQEYFTSENIPDTKKEDTYFLNIGDLTTTLNDTDYRGEIDVIVQIWKNGNNDVLNRLDNAYCNAIEIQRKLMDKRRLPQNGSFIKGVLGSGIVVTPVESNDNLAQYELSFTVITGYNSK